MSNQLTPFSELRIGNINLKNRLFMAPVKTAFGDKSGEVSHRHLSYYHRRAEGGVGVIITEPLYVSDLGKEHPKQLGISTYKHVSGLKKLVETIHEGGAAAIAHINHGGRAANPKVTGKSPEAPSEVVCPKIGVTPVPLTTKRIQELVREFTGAVERSIEAGFDAVELQFGLGYLINQFISLTTNHRKDHYGESWENRLRFGKEILQSIYSIPDLKIPIIARISATATGKESELGESIELAKWLEEAGLSAIHVVSGAICETPPLYFQHMRLPKNKNLEWASEIKKMVSIPVIVAGRLGNPILVRESLAENLVDGIALGRPLVADPDFPSKLRDKRDDDIFECGACLQGCFMNVKSGKGISCLINPEVGRESELVPKPNSIKKVTIVGGGPAGIQAAITLHKRGHDVKIYDQGTLGGRFNLAVIPPGKQEMNKPLNSLINNLKKTNVQVRLEQTVTVQEILNENPDHVLLATGSNPRLPVIEGIEEIYSAETVLENKANVGKRVLVMGAGMVGLETAEFLAKSNHEVTIIEILDQVAQNMEMITSKLIQKSLSSSDVKILLGKNLKRFDGKKAYAEGDSAEEFIGEFDTVVAAIGYSTDSDFESEIRKHGIAVDKIGDATNPSNIYNAVTDGYDVACKI